MRFTLLLLVWTACAGRDAQAPPLLYDAAPSEGRDAFFDALLAADYATLDPIIDTLDTEAMAGDETSQAVLGFAHMWRLSESRRDANRDDSVVEYARLGMDAFERAVEQTPEDSRLVGFLGAAKQAVGSIEDRNTLVQQGWFDTKESTRRWPEWGLFTQAYGLVSLETDHRLFDRGIDMYWRTLDECVDGVVDERLELDWRDHADVAVATGDPMNVRACTNTPVVPHNLEGFFVVMADMIAKKGDVEQAAVLYQNALWLDDGTWPYRALAEDRLQRVEDLPALFATPPADEDVVEPTEMVVFQSAASCAICHQGALPQTR